MPRRLFEFESFRVDVSERQLRRDGIPVSLTPKVFDMLLVLLENRGETVEKERLIREVWADTYVEEGSLNRSISTLRKALGDDAYEQRLIKTLPKRGYRFTENVREFSEDPLLSSIETATVQPTMSGAVLAPFGSRVLTRGRLIGGVIVAAALCFAAVTWNVGGNQKASESIQRLTGHEQRQLIRSGGANSHALEDFVEGRRLWRERSAEGLHQSILHLERAVRKDEDFALAHAALADAYAFDTKMWSVAKDRAQLAIKLDPTIGEPYATIGFVEMFWEWKLDDASRSLRKAVELSPEYATAHQWYAISLAAGRLGGSALSEMKRAEELEPDSLSISADLCQVYYFLQKHDDAIEQCNKTLAADPRFLNAHLYLYDIYSAKGMHQEAVAKFFEIERLKSDFATPHEDLLKLQHAFADSGIEGFWKARIAYLETRPHYYALAKYWARLGKKDNAIAALERSKAVRDLDFIYFKTDPSFYLLHGDPRFIELGRSLTAGD